MKLDLQVHSFPSSSDSKIDASDLARACARVGLDGLALTEHGPPEPDEAIRLMREAGLLLVTAREVSCAGAHLLLITSDLDLLRSVPRVIPPEHPSLHRDDVAVVWAHPAAPSGSSAYAPVHADPAVIGQLVDAVEVLNGRHLHFPDTVRRAQSLCASLALPGTGGSDAHRPAEVGRCFTRIDAQPRDGVDGVVAALKQGRAAAVLSADWMGMQGYDYRSELMGFLG